MYAKCRWRGKDYHHMAHNLCVRINFECINGKKCVSFPGEGSIYLEHTFDNPALNILISDNYMNWEENEV
jgi:hypothetical protein